MVRETRAARDVKTTCKYAYFSSSRRLLLRAGDEVMTYNTGEHDIRGVSQASAAAQATFTSEHGVVQLSEFKRV